MHHTNPFPVFATVVAMLLIGVVARLIHRSGRPGIGMLMALVIGGALLFSIRHRGGLHVPPQISHLKQEWLPRIAHKFPSPPPLIVHREIAPPPAPHAPAAPLERVEIAQTPAGDSIEEYELYAGLNSDGVAVDQPPPWVSDTENNGGTVILESQRYASVEEAENDLWLQLRQRAGELLAEHVPNAKGWMPDQAVLERSLAVIERFVEKSTLVVGEFPVPMYRVHWRVSLNDQTRDFLARVWQPTFTHDRAFSVIGGFAIVSLALAALNLLLRGVSSIRMPKKRTIGATVAGLLLAAGIGSLWMLG
jgi:hypothetical protein